MAKITNAASIPASMQGDLKAVIRSIGPAVLGAKWPEGVDPANLTNAQLAQVFEQVTREFWTQQIQAYKANEAAEVARQKVISESSADPFGPS